MRSINHNDGTALEHVEIIDVVTWVVVHSIHIMELVFLVQDIALVVLRICNMI